MKTSLFRLTLAALLAAALHTARAEKVVAAPPAKDPAPAKVEKAKSDKGEKSDKPATKYPFHGTVKSVDAKAMTITLEGKEHDRVLHLDGNSRLAKDGKDITLSAVAAGEHLRGTLSKNARNEEVVVRGTAGPKPEKKDKEDGEPKHKGKDKKKD